MFFHNTKIVDVSFGEFHCPKCARLTTYWHKEKVRKRNIRLFFTILGETLEEFVECQTCKTKYSLEILRAGISADARQVLESLKEKLASGISLQEAETLLSATGAAAGSVKRYVSVAAGIAHRKCPRCQLTYVASVHKCHKCGNSLPEKTP